MAGAARAQALVRLWTDDGAPPLASPAVLTVIAGLPGVGAIAAMGLAQVADEGVEK